MTDYGWITEEQLNGVPPEVAGRLMLSSLLRREAWWRERISEAEFQGAVNRCRALMRREAHD